MSSLPPRLPLARLSRRLLTGVLLPCLLLSGLLLLAAPARAQDDPNARPPVSKATRSIAITATDHVTAEADVASVHIGYALFGPTKDAAYAAGSEASNAIIDALRKAGVPADAIESQAQSLAPTQEFQLNQLPPAERAAHAFAITQSWTVCTAAPDAARVLDLAVKAGANQSGDIDWSLRDPDAAATQAAAKALQRARTQADAMAAGLGVHLGDLLYASNQVDAQPVRPIMMALTRSGTSAKEVRPLALNARQIETSATVYAVFAIQ